MALRLSAWDYSTIKALMGLSTRAFSSTGSSASSGRCDEVGERCSELRQLPVVDLRTRADWTSVDSATRGA